MFPRREQMRFVSLQRLSSIPGNLGVDAGRGPSGSVPRDIKEPNDPIRSLPDDRVSIPVKGRVRNGVRRLPCRFTGLLPRAKDGSVILVLTCAAVVNEVKIAVVQLGDGGRMLVPSRHLRAEDLLNVNFFRGERRREKEGEKEPRHLAIHHASILLKGLLASRSA